MIKNLIAQINHLGYKINQDPLNMSSWKIAVPNDSLSLYTLDYEKNKIFLYKDDICLCEISDGEDPFLILRHLPTNSFLNSNPIKTPIESLYILCDIRTRTHYSSIIFGALTNRM